MRVLRAFDFSWFPGRADAGFLVAGLGMGIMTMAFCCVLLSVCWSRFVRHSADGALPFYCMEDLGVP